MKIIIMMKYSNGDDETNCHIRYFNESVSVGMNLDVGLAFSAKSMHCFYKHSRYE